MTAKLLPTLLYSENEKTLNMFSYKFHFHKIDLN